MNSLIFMIRETLQMKILSEIFWHTRRRDMILKGGMAMRITANSLRYTKDIDLDANPLKEPEYAKETIRAAIRKATVTCSNYIRNARVTEPKQTDTTLRWKINGTIADTGEPFNLTVEVSRRGLLNEDHVITTTFVPPSEYNLSPVTLETYDAQALIVAKMNAMLNDNRDAPRDLYDLHILFSMNVEPDAALMTDFIKRHSMPAEELAYRIWNKLDMMTWERFREEVIPYLEKAEASRITEEYFHKIVMMTGEKIETIITRFDPGENNDDHNQPGQTL
ncbi:MAG: nucleotidyl transferase AbiEii/AbiGii toxin family protein [Syntrophorhabdaceae bacterium]